MQTPTYRLSIDTTPRTLADAYRDALAHDGAVTLYQVVDRGALAFVLSAAHGTVMCGAGMTGPEAEHLYAVGLMSADDAREAGADVPAPAPFVVYDVIRWEMEGEPRTFATYHDEDAAIACAASIRSIYNVIVVSPRTVTPADYR